MKKMMIDDYKKRKSDFNDRIVLHGRSYGIVVVCLSIILSATPSYAKETHTQSILQKIQTATGGGVTRHESVSIKSNVEYYGIVGIRSVTFGAKGEFVEHTEGVMGESYGFDGKKGWAKDYMGNVRSLELDSLQSLQLAYWILSGWWTSDPPAMNIQLEQDQSTDKYWSIHVSLTAGQLEADVLVDRETYLPRVVRCITAGANDEWTFNIYRSFDQLQFPTKIARTDSIGNVESWDVQALMTNKHSNARLFDIPQRHPVRFESKNQSKNTLETKVALTGHVLVRPMLNGQDTGWFILDSGAEMMCVSPEVADLLHLEYVGEVLGEGVVGSEKIHFRGGASFSIGPVHLKEVYFAEVDLSPYEKYFGEKVVGVCGYEFFNCTIVEYDVKNKTVTLHDPSRYTLSQGNWSPLHFSGKTPVFEAQFSDHQKGLLKMDTGSNATLTFFQTAIHNMNLKIKDNEQSKMVGGLGGTTQVTGGILESVIVGGIRFDQVKIDVASVNEGAFYDAFTMGNIGNTLFKDYTLIFDYPTQRYAILRSD